jgi:uncharacterized protein (TIGR03663 family)
MSKAAFWILFLATLVLAVGIRLLRLDVRPMHHDEANQAIKFGTLLETGDYRYDRNDHHGPTLYYATLPVALVRGQKSLSSLDEWTLRAVPVMFGAGLILLFTMLTRSLGREPVFWSALLAALSPSLTYYNRFYIQESLFVFFVLGFLIALGRYALRPTFWSACTAGVCAGLAYATKETSILVFTSSGAAMAITLAWTGRNPQGTRFDARTRGSTIPHLVAGLAAAVGIAAVLYSSFLRNPGGILESVAAFKGYASRGNDAGLHAHPWFYYLQILAFSRSGGFVWTEGLILLLALFGIFAAIRRGTANKSLNWLDLSGGLFWPRYLFLYSVLTAMAFAIIRYKTPWNLLPFYIGFILLAGIGAAALRNSFRSELIRKLLIVVILADCIQLGIQSRRANFLYPADPRNPYAYAQTSTDFLRLSRRIHDLAAVCPDGRKMLVKVIAGPYEQWPLPWYLRDLERVGYWTNPADAGGVTSVPVIIASRENASQLEKVLDPRCQTEYYGLRPNVLLTMFIDRPLWDLFMSRK